MATKKSKAKRYCVQRHIDFRTADISQSVANIIDVPKCLSKVNHRLYRQSRLYRVKLDVIKPTERGAYNVFVLRDTWMLQKAYQMAKDTFDKNTIEERSGIVSTNVARWQDFRIDLDPKFGVANVDLNPAVYNGDDFSSAVALTSGEFELSLVHDEDGNNRSFGLYEIANAKFGIVKEYDRAGNANDQPSNPTGGNTESPYGGLDDDNQNASRTHLSTAGNSPPYDGNSLEHNFLFRHVATIGGESAGAQKLSTGFFDAPLGAVYVTTSDTPGPLQLVVQSGDYKGVHGETYIDANKKFGHRRA